MAHGGRAKLEYAPSSRSSRNADTGRARQIEHFVERVIQDDDFGELPFIFGDLVASESVNRMGDWAATARSDVQSAPALEI